MLKMKTTVEIGTDGGVIKDDDITVCFVNSETPPNRKNFVGLFVKKQEPQSIGGVTHYVLYRIDRVFYPHPQSPKDAEISALETSVVNSEREDDPGASHLIVLYHAQEYCKGVF